MSRTPLDAYISQAASDIKFFTAKVDSELRWLEGNIRDLRGEVERGSIFEQRNLISKAADVADAAGKLRAAYERLGVLREIKNAGGNS